MDESKLKRSHTRIALYGLLSICSILALGLIATAFYNLRATHHAANEMLKGHAQEVANVFSATLHLTNFRSDPMTPQEVADAIKSHGVEIHLFEPEAKKTIASSPSKNKIPRITPTIESALEKTGIAFSNEKDGISFYRRVGRFRRPPRPWRKRPPLGPRKRFAPRRAILQIKVNQQMASGLLRTAQSTMVLATMSGLLLLLLAFAFYRQAQKSAQAEAKLRRAETLSTLGEMAAILAHEIRTPLASMKGNAQLLLESEKENQSAQSIASEAKRLERLVNDMLDYARPKALEKTKVDPDQLIKRTAMLVAPKAEKASVFLMTEGSQSGEILNADPDRIIQVLVNITQNAIEASQGVDGAESVTLKTYNTQSDIIFEVIDRGKGLETTTDKLSKTFFSTKKDGSGLGLSIAQRIAEQHGGQLTLNAAKERGAVATLRLPRG